MDHGAGQGQSAHPSIPTSKAADVRPCQGNPKHLEVEYSRDTVVHVLSTGCVVAQPVSSISSGTSKRGTGQHEGSLALVDGCQGIVGFHRLCKTLGWVGGGGGEEELKQVSTCS